jgi:hypothetical protein
MPGMAISWGCISRHGLLIPLQGEGSGHSLAVVDLSGACFRLRHLREEPQGQRGDQAGRPWRSGMPFLMLYIAVVGFLFATRFFMVSSSLGEALSCLFPRRDATTPQAFIHAGSQPFLRTPQRALGRPSKSPAAPLFMPVVSLWRLVATTWEGDNERRRLRTMPICSLSGSYHLLLESSGKRSQTASIVLPVLPPVPVCSPF